jgi:hypothetical protein
VGKSEGDESDHDLLLSEELDGFLAVLRFGGCNAFAFERDSDRRSGDRVIG